MPEDVMAATPRTALEHFKLYFYGAVLAVLEQVIRGFDSPEATFEQFPFLLGYNNELANYGLEGYHSSAALAGWQAGIENWERTAEGHLPLKALREVAALDYAAVTLLVSIGLVEEDARFGFLFETLQGLPGQPRPTLSLLNAFSPDPDELRTNLRRLQELGLIEVANPQAPRAQWVFQTPSVLWEALRGESYQKLAQWLEYKPREQLLPLEKLTLPDEAARQLAMLPKLLTTGEAQALIVRGPQHNGRRTVLGAVAHSLGRNVLEINGLSQPDDGRWKLVGPLASLLHAMPLVVLELAAGETVELPRLAGYAGPVGVALGRPGGLRGPVVERALTLNLDLPDAAARARHWQAGLGEHPITHLTEISERFRMTGGNIRRAAQLALAWATLNGRTEIGLTEVQQASRALNRQVLETLAAHVPVSGDWQHLAVGTETLQELANLESRCRYREELQKRVGPALQSQLNAGVRALLSGPSGTGKTLAARLLAAVLQKDLYRLDLSAVVNKYIGETEKSLSQVFARAEELDVILLLDEGDALLTRRTNVHTSNDRYANLETNYLLQRLESFEGILLVTTNASDRIDSAFQRRMDVVIEFRPPEMAERWAIWQLHLPIEHGVGVDFLKELARRCTLTGGQIRNAVLHASLLALNEATLLNSAQLEAAVQREYRKSGEICPLRPHYGKAS